MGLALGGLEGVSSQWLRISATHPSWLQTTTQTMQCPATVKLQLFSHVQ